MNVLVTAGNTQAPIDQVRCITNIFSGRTGARIAREAHRRGWDVTFLTSRPEALQDLGGGDVDAPRWRMREYRTFDDLLILMREEITSGKFDAVIHSAAVSDYFTEGVYAASPGLEFDAKSGVWKGTGKLVDVQRGKVKSSHLELWLRLVPAPKLVDQIRKPWGFGGVLVKFKLEVGASEEELRQVAEASRIQSQADLMVANTLEGMDDWALVGAGEYRRVSRGELALEVLNRVELLTKSRKR